MKIKLMIAAVIACLVFTGFTKENLSDTIDHNACTGHRTKRIKRYIE